MRRQLGRARRPDRGDAARLSLRSRNCVHQARSPRRPGVCGVRRGEHSDRAGEWSRSSSSQGLRQIVRSPVSTEKCWPACPLKSSRESSRGGDGTVVRVIDHPEMQAAAAYMAGRLRLSGFCGFDFVLDAEGRAHLIELNARPTPVAHFPDDHGRTLAGVLYQRLTGTVAAASAEPLPSRWWRSFRESSGGIPAVRFWEPLFTTSRGNRQAGGRLSGSCAERFPGRRRNPPSSVRCARAAARRRKSGHCRIIYVLPANAARSIRRRHAPSGRSAASAAAASVLRARGRSVLAGVRRGRSRSPARS